MDVTYLWGGAGDDELRHSLRSVCENMPDVERVIVAGQNRPAWLRRVDWVAVTPPRQGKHWSTWANLSAAAHVDGREEFALFNDDFFVLRPHRGPVPVLTRGQIGDVDPAPAGPRKVRNVAAVVPAMLDAMGVPGRLDFELHIPMMMRRDVLADVVARADACRPPRDEPLGKRTLYGNAAGLTGPAVDDVKYRSFRQVPTAGEQWVSTSEFTWRTGQIGVWLRRRFPDPCRYEKEWG